MSDTLALGDAAPDFCLPGTDGKTWRRADVAGPNGLVVMFICNHCPFVKAVADRIEEDAKLLRAAGVGMVAISSNDAATYPEDSFDRMGEFARRHGFDFPYLYDESQAVARAYGAVCTPDIFGLDQAGALRYRGRLDAAGRNPPTPGMKRDLVDAMRQLVETGEAPTQQYAAIGCSIKWRT